MSADYDKQGIYDFFKRLPRFVRENLLLATPQHTKRDHMLHISKDTDIAQFFPQVSRRTIGSTEDRRVPRVCVAPTLAGCILGYSSTLAEFHARQPVNKHIEGQVVRQPFKGGWMIYGVPYKAALRPTAKLLPDVERTDEHWLVTYNEETVDYVALPVGRFFFNAVTYRPNCGENGEMRTEVEMLIEVLQDEISIPFDSAIKLKRGCWKIVVGNFHNKLKWYRMGDVRVDSMPRDEYLQAKRLVASLLSHESPVTEW